MATLFAIQEDDGKLFLLPPSVQMTFLIMTASPSRCDLRTYR